MEGSAEGRAVHEGDEEMSAFLHCGGHQRGAIYAFTWLACDRRIYDSRYFQAEIRLCFVD